MRRLNRGAIPSDIGGLIDYLDDLARRIDTLEAPSGEALSSTVKKLERLIANIQSELDQWAAGRRTDAQTDAIIDQKIAAYVAAYLAGNVTIGGALNVLGTASFPGARGTSLGSASNRVTAWLGGPDDARLGHTS
jgi:hypothetical protein